MNKRLCRLLFLCFFQKGVSWYNINSLGLLGKRYNPNLNFLNFSGEHALKPLEGHKNLLAVAQFEFF